MWRGLAKAGNGRSNGLGKPEARRSWHEAKSSQTMSGCCQLQLEWVPLMPSPGCEPPTPARHRRRRYIFRRRRRNAQQPSSITTHIGEDFPTPSIPTPSIPRRLTAVGWQQIGSKLAAIVAPSGVPSTPRNEMGAPSPDVHPPVFREAEAREMVRA